MKKTTEQLAKAAAIGIVAGTADAVAVTTGLHRAYTHKSVKFNKPIDTVLRTVIWGTGTKRRTWAALHRIHHEEADTPLDPYSPQNYGKWGMAKLFVRNTPDYTKSAKEFDAENNYPPDLQPDRLDELIFDKKKLGLAASLAGHAALNKMVGNPAYMGVASFAVEKLIYTKAGDFVNTMGHGGVHPLRSFFTGQIEPHPDGSYGADVRWLRVPTIGEGNQYAHHKEPKKVYFGDHPEEMTPLQRAVHDPGGALSLWTIDKGWAELGTAPPAPETPTDFPEQLVA